MNSPKWEAQTFFFWAFCLHHPLKLTNSLIRFFLPPSLFLLRFFSLSICKFFSLLWFGLDRQFVFMFFCAPPPLLLHPAFFYNFRFSNSPSSFFIHSLILLLSVIKDGSQSVNKSEIEKREKEEELSCGRKNLKGEHEVVLMRKKIEEARVINKIEVRSSVHQHVHVLNK